MALMNIGGRMPDGAGVREFWVDESDFICASGSALQVEGSKTKLKGKLCLITSALIMLPYEGKVLKIGEFLIGKLQGAILGEFADMAGWMDRLGLIDLKANFENLDQVLMWPLELLEGEARVELHTFLFLRGGASLIVTVGGKDYDFLLANRGHEIVDAASAQDFCEHINQLT